MYAKSLLLIPFGPISPLGPAGPSLPSLPSRPENEAILCNFKHLVSQQYNNKNKQNRGKSEFINYQQVQGVLACHLSRLDLKKITTDQHFI